MTFVAGAVFLARTSPLRRSGIRWVFSLICGSSSLLFPRMTYCASMTEGLAPWQYLALPCSLPVSGSDINMGPGWGFCTSYPSTIMLLRVFFLSLTLSFIAAPVMGNCPRPQFCSKCPRRITLVIRYKLNLKGVIVSNVNIRILIASMMGWGARYV